MIAVSSFIACSCALLALAAPAPAPVPESDVIARAALAARAGLTPYQPVPTTCPTTPLVRPATGINSQESSYISLRRARASIALASWLKKQGNFTTATQPVVGLTSSGGGYRSLLESAGVLQAFDARDSTANVSGVYQALTYHAGLSGGAWFLSSLSGNNWPTVSYLRDNLWEQAFQNSLLLPANILSTSAATEYALITTDIGSKQAANYDVSVVDPYGRLLSYQLLQGPDGGVATYMSSLATFSNFTNYNVPYTVITALGALVSKGQCAPPLNATQYEFGPYEFGSWDAGVSAFTQTKYLGSNLSNGKPVVPAVCTAQYDNLGYIFGTSSDVFPGACEVVPASNSSSAPLVQVLEGLVSTAKAPAVTDLYGLYKNPFYNYSRSSLVSNDQELTLADGGLAGQNNPIWPFIQPARSIDVLIVNDNSADTSDNFPNGTEIRQTYLNAQAAGLKKMPYIPDVATFVSQGLNKRATFFGCNETGTTFIVFLPNVNYTYPSNQPTSKLQYSVAETDGMIANGNAIATQNGAKGWSFCLACAVKNKDTTKLPAGCNACFSKYCYKR
nr:hypothetical protein B0A51_01101 [Rachicladosporium sp. CCFEE 5018]